MSFFKAWSDADQPLVKTLGEPVTLPDGRVVSGIFEFPTNDGALGNLPMDYRSPEVTLTDQDASGLQKGDVLTIRNSVYTIGKPRPSGDGVTVLPLAEGQDDPNTGRWK